MKLDRDVLAEWVVSESQALGSQTGLAQRLGIKPQALIKWKNRLVGKLGEDSIEAIARYRGETIEETRKWLSGLRTSKSDLLLNLARQASIDAVFLEAAQIMQARLSQEYLRLLEQQQGDKSQRKAKNRAAEIDRSLNQERNIQPGAYAVGELIRQAIAGKSYNPDDEDDLMFFISGYPRITTDEQQAAREIEHLKAVIHKEVPFVDNGLIDLGFLALTLREWAEESRYTMELLLQLNTPNSNHEPCQSHPT